VHGGILAFARKHAPRFSGKVLEVGSFDVNGTLRDALPITRGVDMRPGPKVDEVVDASDLLAVFGPDSFDGVCSADALEHIEDWQSALSNIWGVLRTGGPLLITMAAPTKGVHGYPHDYWRWPMDRWKRLFGDNKIVGEFVGSISQGVCVIKTGPLDLSHLPDTVQ
jgi:SAM-dependent methyltransferase